MRDSYNIIPVTFALILHVIVFGSLFVAFDWTRSAPPLTPLAINATLVTESEVAPPRVEPPPVVEPEPEPEPEQPDAEQLEQQRLEAQALREEAANERARLQRIEEAKAEAERRRQAELAAEAEAKRKAEEEAELERQRQEVERKRQEDIERQREANRREQQRLERERLEAEIAAEAEHLEAMNSDAMRAYQAAIQQKVQRNWTRPATAPDNLECLVAVQQLPNGEVISVQVRRCNGDDVVVRSIEAAVRKASPLPQPSNPLLFLREFEFRFTIRD